MTVQDKPVTKGCEFIIKETDPSAVFTPDDFNEEQKMLRESMRDFLDREIEPIKEKFDTTEGHDLAPGILEKMGALGFLGLGVPEVFGGIEADFRTQLAFGEIASDSFAFSQSIGVHTSLGVAPVLLYGTQTQKEKYLPKIVTAEIKGCYCLTEPGAGSDANSGKTKAVLSENEESYILNGQKMWITNSGFADIFFVFCKIEEDKTLSCLIVEKAFGGIKLGPEEKKMGIHGSSTRQVFFENVEVPIANLLGTREGGFKIALNVLNTGRIKIGVAGTAVAKRALRLSIEYARQRVQFNQPIIEFGAIQHKIAEVASRIYGSESSWCRVSGQIDAVHDDMIADGMDPLEAKYKSVAELAMECAITKVYGSEVETRAVDEGVQIHGGMGFSAESEIETLYRNARGNRIYEGTNEINRILAPTSVFRKVMKGMLDLTTPAMEAIQNLHQITPEPLKDSGSYDLPQEFLRRLKTVSLICSGMAAQKLMAKLTTEQEVLMNLADIFIQVFVLESAILRTRKHDQVASSQCRQDMVTLLQYEAASVVEKSAYEVMYAITDAADAVKLMSGIKAMILLPPHNLKETRRQVAEYFGKQGAYSV